MFRTSHIVTLGLTSLISLNLLAESSGHDHDHDMSGQDAHLHGYAELTLALEGNILEISLESPSANIVGFEYKATSPEQIQVAKNAKAVLESPEGLFTFSGGSCSLQKSNADLSTLIEEVDEDDSHHEEQHHGHDDHDGEHEEIHSEISASYSYVCQQGETLDTVTIKLIEQFPGIEKLKAMWLTDTKQGAVELTATSNHIRIR